MRHLAAMFISTLLLIAISSPFHIQKMKTGRAGYWDCEYQLLKYSGSNKLFRAVTHEISSYMKKDLSDYLSTCEAVSKTDPKPEFAWSFESSIDVVLSRASLVSVEVETSSFAGGAHPNTYAAQLVFGVVHGKPLMLKLKDLFKTDEDARKVVSNLLIPILKEKGASNLLDSSVTELAPDLVEKFLVLPKGLRFDFSAYDVGSYAEGPYTVTIPYSKLRSHLNLRGPINAVLR